MRDVKKLGFARQRRKQRRIGAGEPGLSAEIKQRLEQHSPAFAIKMGGDLVEQDDRRGAVLQRLEVAEGDQYGDDQGLLLTRRTARRGGIVADMNDMEIVAVGAMSGAADQRIVVA